MPNIDPAYDRHDSRVHEARKAFRQSVDADTDEVPYFISHAAYTLQLGSGLQLSSHDRDELLFAIFSAADSACRRLPASYSREQIRRGFRAFASIVEYWSECPIERQAWGDKIADARAVARMFRNDAHNMSLAAEIRCRAHNRRDEIISGLATGT